MVRNMNKSEETANWVKAQNEVTFDYLSQIPYRDQIKNRLTELWNYEKTSTPFNKGNYYFYYNNDGIQNQYVLYYKDSLEGEEKVLLILHMVGQWHSGYEWLGFFKRC